MGSVRVYVDTYTYAVETVMWRRIHIYKIRPLIIEVRWSDMETYIYVSGDPREMLFGDLDIYV